MIRLNKIGILLLGVLITGAPSFALETSLQPLVPLPQESLKLGTVKPETKAFRIIRDGGIGLGAGALSGLSFVVLTQGRLPRGTSRFDNDALTTGLLMGLIGGVITGVWETKHDPLFVKSN